MNKTMLIIISLMLTAIPVSLGLLNPSAVYCNELGYRYSVALTDFGQKGVCLLPSGEEVDAWPFFRGETGDEYSYCNIMGYETAIIKGKPCTRYLMDECLGCRLPSGKTVEVIELMNASLGKAVCGDGLCDFSEDYSECPDDCLSGGDDGYCDMVDDGICDPDCTEEQDEDCVGLGDSDGDGILDNEDNCPEIYNPEQLDCNGNWIGDKCDPINPDAEEIYDGIDNNCNCLIDEGCAEKLKEEAIELLESSKNEVKQCKGRFWQRLRCRLDNRKQVVMNRMIERIIQNIESSLDEKYWKEDSRLDPDDGKRVFHHEARAAVMCITRAGALKEICSKVEKNLVDADRLLAGTAFSDGQDAAISNSVNKACYDKMLKNAERAMEKGDDKDELAIRAIMHYMNSWKFAQEAIRYAEAERDICRQ